MRKIERATAFRHDYRQFKATARYRKLDHRLIGVLELLINDQPLPLQNRDHPSRPFLRGQGLPTGGAGAAAPLL